VSEVRVRNHTNLRVNANALRGRSVAEFVGSAYLFRSTQSESTPVRTFDKDGKKAALFLVRGSGVYLAVGDDKTVAVIACLGANLSEDDPIVKAILDSVSLQ
jgi:hypothetical protein